MLKLEEQYVLHLLRVSLGRRDSWDDSSQIDEKSVISILRRNGVLDTVFYSLPNDMQEPYRIQMITSFSHSLSQSYEGEEILRILSKRGMDCIALKGWELRKLYPKEHMRQMADIDIFVRPYHFSKIEEAMLTLGYTSQGLSSWKHDNFIKGSITVEMHKRLTDDSDIIQAWEHELWERTIPTMQPHVLRMAPEDFYIFHFVHLHKDFLNGSLGLRRIADTWLLQQKENFDIQFVKSKLEQFGMWGFHQRMIALCKAAFGEKEISLDDEILLRHAFIHGIYGSDKSYKAGRIAKMSSKSFLMGRLLSGIRAVFLPYNRMKAQFPILQRKPFLLPFCWIKRIWSLSHRGIRIKERLNYKDISVEDYEDAKTFFKAGGIL